MKIRKKERVDGRGKRRAIAYPKVDTVAKQNKR